MVCLTRFLSLILGDLVPEDNVHWKYYITLRKIIGIITSPRIVESEILVLKQLIIDHNSMYRELYGDLKPKMHFLTHYPRLLALNGPLIHLWGMPFERKNKQLKEHVSANKSSKDLPSTIGVKNQLLLCYLKEFGPFHAKKLRSIEVLGKTFCNGTVFLMSIVNGVCHFGKVKCIYEIKNNIYTYA